MRKAVGLPAVTLAELLDTSPETVSRWERGVSHIDRAAFAILAGIDRILSSGSGPCVIPLVSARWFRSTPDGIFSPARRSSRAFRRDPFSVGRTSPCARGARKAAGRGWLHAPAICRTWQVATRSDVTAVRPASQGRDRSPSGRALAARRRSRRCALGAMEFALQRFLRRLLSAARR